MIKEVAAMNNKHKLFLSILITALLFPFSSSGEDKSPIKSTQMTPRERLETYLTLGEIYQKQKYPQKAIAVYRKALKLDDRDPDIYKSLGKLYSNIKQYNDAAEAYKNALKLTPGDEMTTQSLAAAYRDSGDYNQAITLYNTILSSSANRFPRQYIFQNIISTYRKAGRLDDLKTETEARIKKEPGQADWYLLLGKIYQQEKSWEETIVTYRKALEIDPRSDEVLSSLAMVYNMRRMYPEAAQIYEDIIALTPDQSWNYERSAEAYIKAGQFEKAEEVLERLVKLQPRKASTYLSMTEVYLDGKKFSRAQESARKAVELDPSESRNYQILAKAYEAGKEYSQAAEAYQKMLEYSDSTWEREQAQSALIKLYDKTGNLDELARELEDKLNQN